MSCFNRDCVRNDEHGAEDCCAHAGAELGELAAAEAFDRRATILPPKGDTVPCPPPSPEKAEARRAVDVILAIAEAVRAAKEIPSGHLYAMLCGAIDLPAYRKVLGILQRAGVVEEKGHLVRWIGPEVMS
jgi:hypothetical protein